MIIGGVDHKETSKLKRKAEGEEAKRRKMRKTDESKSQADSSESAEDDTDSSDSATVDVCFPESVKTKPKPERECKKTPTFTR